MTDGQVVVSVWHRGSATPATTTLNHEDDFSFASVVPPYDVLVDVAVGPGVTTRSRQLLAGLTRSDPTVVYLGKSPTPFLAARGLTLSPGTAHGWQTLTYDDIAGPDAFATMNATRGSVAARESGYRVSLRQEFQTD